MCDNKPILFVHLVVVMKQNTKIQITNTNSTINCKLFEVSIWILCSVVSMFQFSNHRLQNRFSNFKIYLVLVLFSMA